MKKIFGILVLTGVMSMVILNNAFACEGQDKGKMMGMMHDMKPSMVSSSDGGVIVMSGNHLTKYDKNLNVVKEVEIKGGMKGMCPMCEKKMKMGKGMMDKGMMGGAAQQAEKKTPEPEAAVSAEVDHTSHH